MAELQQYRRADVAKHNTNQSCWIVINNKVYDVTQFLDEHPGGIEVLLEHGGKDGTEDFEDIGHSTDAREMQAGMLIGEIVPEEHEVYAAAKKWSTPATTEEKAGFGNAFYAVLASVALFLLYKYFVG